MLHRDENNIPLSLKIVKVEKVEGKKQLKVK